MKRRDFMKAVGCTPLVGLVASRAGVDVLPVDNPKATGY